MNRFIEFSYETLKGQMLEISGKTDGVNVKFIAYLNNQIAMKSMLTSIDVRNIEEFILDNSEPEMEFNDLDYRNDR